MIVVFQLWIIKLFPFIIDHLIQKTDEYNSHWVWCSWEADGSYKAVGLHLVNKWHEGIFFYIEKKKKTMKSSESEKKPVFLHCI